MSAPEVIVAIYPPPIREQWGSELAREIKVAGPRSWLNATLGAARLWTRPGDWPEHVEGQTTRLVLMELAVIAAIVALMLRGVGRPSARFTADLAHPLTSAWLALILLGLAGALPILPRHRRALRRIVVITVRTMTAPAIAFGVMLAIAWSGLVDHPRIVIAGVLHACYWTTLLFVASRMCVLAHRVSRIAIAPSTHRVRIAMFLVGLGLALAALQNLGDDPAADVAMLSIMLVPIAVFSLTISHNLREPVKD